MRLLTWILSVILSWIVKQIRYGSLTIQYPNGKVERFRGIYDGPDGVIKILDPKAFIKIAFGGSVGFAEAYMDEYWTTPDLSAVLTMAAMNHDVGRGKMRFLPILKGPINRFRHALRPNSVRVAKANISHHYDIGNAFYNLWLDPETLSYSCAIFEKNNVMGQVAQEPEKSISLGDAQVRKFERMLELADVKQGQYVLDIGCGWGGLPIYMARNRGCHVVGITISEEQFRGARKAVDNAGLSDLVEIRLQDYRKIPEPERFDRIVSVGMYEHLGPKYRPEFFQAIVNHLEPEGHAVVHGITVRNDRYEKHVRSTDFSRKYIFPGGSLASPEVFAEEARKSGLETVSTRLFGLHYGETLRRWSANFEAALREVRMLGFDDRFICMWRYYLAYAAAGFDGGHISVMQTVLKPVRK